MERTGVKISKLTIGYNTDCARCYVNHGEMLALLCDYDWRCAFEYADFKREDVKEVMAYSEGDNDGPAWIALFKLENGKFGALNAWCDYTGWD